MKQIKNIFQSQVLLVITLMVSFSGMAMLNAPMVYGASDASDISDAPAMIETLQDYCNKLDISNKAKQACEDTDDDSILVHARNVATHHCKDKNQNNNEKTNCIRDKAEEYLKDGTKDLNKNASQGDFIRKVEAALKAAGGDEDNIDDSAGVHTTQGCDSNDGKTCFGCSNNNCGDPAADPNVNCDKNACDLIKKYVNPLINMLSVVFGLIAVISIIFGGIQYSASGGDPQKVTEAKKRIINTIIAIVCYLFLFAFLQFLVPGGIFNRST